MIRFLRSFEGLSEDERIKKVVTRLEAAGFQHMQRTSRKMTVNEFYYRDDCDTVLCVILCKDDDSSQYVILDKSLFDSEFKNTNRTMSFCVRQDKNKKVVVYGDGYMNMPLHRLALGSMADDMQVDHISRNTFINSREFLRGCIAQENKFNHRYYSKTDKDNLSFNIPDKIVGVSERLALANAGFCFKSNRIWSPKYKNFKELYLGIEKFENRFLKEFRYNPFRDFSETWYVVVIWKMLGLIDELGVDDYQ